MAEYKDVYDNLSKMLECGICMSHLHKPRVLHCHHSFCKDCLDGLLKFNPDGSATLMCPLRCAGKTVIPASQTTGQLGVNYQLLGILDMYKEKAEKPKSTTGDYYCHRCENEVSIYCSGCHNFYCKDCQHEHDKHSTMQITLSQTHCQYLPVCKEHDSLAKFVCCKKIICVYCLERSHVGHQYETIKIHADRFKQLLFNEDSSGKINRIMENAKNNYEGTKSAFAELKFSLVKTLKSRMFTYVSKQITFVENEAGRILHDLDEIICSHLKSYPDITPSDILETVIEKDDLELVVKKDLILNERSRYTFAIPTLTVSLTDALESRSRPLGDLNVQCGEYLSIGNNEKPTSVISKIPDTALIHDVSILVNKLKDLMKEVDIKEGKLSACMPSVTSHYSENKPLVKGPSAVVDQTLMQALSEVDKKGYDYIDELFSNRKEQLLMDIIKERTEFAKLRDSTGVTVLHSASQYGFDKLMRLLLKSKLVEVNAVQKFNQTPLHYAAFHNKAACIKVLLQYDCDISVMNHKGNRPIDVAMQYKSAEALLLLQAADDNIYQVVN